MKRLVLSLFLVLFVAESFAENKFSYWASASVLWGQGSLGTKYHQSTNQFHSLDYNFVYDYWNEFNYHFLRYTLGRNAWRYGITYRWQLDTDEIAPFIGHQLKFDFRCPTHLYNELELRVNSVTKDDYVRSFHVFHVYYPKSFVEGLNIRPYISNGLYVDLEEQEIEKNRFYLGYSFDIEAVRFNIYYIPWKYGNREQEWDDQKRYGLSAMYRF